MAATRWTRDDEDILMANYAGRGASWDGWASLLPGRSAKSIDAKARSMGLSSLGSCSGSEALRLFHGGWEPSRIDRVMGLPDGRARSIVVSEWTRDREMAEARKSRQRA